tara:strand:- start:2549 stop:2932 length:384 start_codon:yes stop_codon:yes gene_type:complete
MITAEHLRETARAICKDLPGDELHDHPAWRAADRIEDLERQMLAGLRALGIGCNSIEQCTTFEREVAGTISVLEERARRAEKQRDQAVNKIVRWCEDPQHRRNRTLNQQCEMLDQLRREMLDISREY